MGYAIRMGIPEMEDLWNSLQTQYRDGSLNKKDRELYKKLLTARAKKYPEPRKPWAKTLCAENKKAADSNTENLQNPNRRLFSSAASRPRSGKIPSSHGPCPQDIYGYGCCSVFICHFYICKK